jgi:nucleoside-diphosphate-sugar epimerase
VSECLFLAGASGVIGRRLAPLLVASGSRVVGTTLSRDLIPILREMAVGPVVIDVFDADGLRNAMGHVRPSVVVHQLTALPPGLDPSKMREALVRNDPAYASGQREESFIC